MNTNDIISFFDSHAEHWDEYQERNEDVIEKILDSAGITDGINVLDVACGTGILFPDYIKRNVASLTGIDISPEMVKIAKSKFRDYEIICADASDYIFEKQFDAVVIYNAFPHFISKEKLISNLSDALKQGGRLTVAHGMSKAELDKFHAASAGRVSDVLPDKEELAEMISAYFHADIMISDESMYLVSGIKK